MRAKANTLIVAAMLVAAAAASPGAKAQSDDEPGALVSNFAEALLKTPSPDSGGEWSQGFTTGGSRAGYTLTSVDIYNYVSTIHYEIALCAASANGRAITSECTELTNATTSGNAVEGAETFSAPTPIELEPGTQYAVLVTFNTNTELGNTISLEEDEEGEGDWSIADRRWWRPPGGSWARSTKLLMISINGHVNPVPSLSELRIIDSEDRTLIDGEPAVNRQLIGVEAAVDEVSVFATPSPEDATVDYLDRRGAALADADDVEDGWQVELDDETTTFKVKVTLADGTLSTTYTVDVVKELCADVATNPLCTSETAVLRNVPESKDRLSRFTVELDYGQEVVPPDWNGTADIRDWIKTLGVRVTGSGELLNVRRVIGGSNRRWHLDITATLRTVTRRGGGWQPGGPNPDPDGDLHIWVSDITTSEGHRIEGTEVTVPGALAVSVHDARAREAPGAKLAFAVTLNRTSTGTVRVSYRTRNGSAKAGSDYARKTGTLVFAPGETEKTVEVTVLEDSIDEPRETMKLKLSKARGARIDPRRRTAEGVITNTDPVQHLWLALFGNRAATHVLEAAEARMGTPPAVGLEARLAGRTLRNWGAHDAKDAGTGHGRTAPGTTLGAREVLSGAAFAAAGGSESEVLYGVWAGGAASRFEGTEGTVEIEGDVTSAMLGADFRRGPIAAGAIVSRAHGEGTYRGQADGGAIESTLVGIYPWGRYAPSETVSVWGLTGYGTGTMTLRPDGQGAMRADTALAMAAAGVRRVLVRPPEGDGVELAMKGDVLGVRMGSDAVPGMAAGRGETTRLRLGLESSRHGLTLGSGTFTPRLEAAVRHDGGDAETGFGVEVGGGLEWSNAAGTLHGQVSGRGLLTHESEGFRDRGFAGALSLDPRPASDRGLELTLRQTVGAPTTGGVDTLLGHRTLDGLGDTGEDELAHRRLELRAGYGLPAFGGRLTATPEVGLVLSESTRDWRAGWRLAPAQSGQAPAELRVEATRRETGDETPEHGIGLSLRARW